MPHAPAVPAPCGAGGHAAAFGQVRSVLQRSTCVWWEDGLPRAPAACRCQHPAGLEGMQLQVVRWGWRLLRQRQQQQDASCLTVPGLGWALQGIGATPWLSQPSNNRRRVFGFQTPPAALYHMWQGPARIRASTQPAETWHHNSKVCTSWLLFPWHYCLALQAPGLRMAWGIKLNLLKLVTTTSRLAGCCSCKCFALQAPGPCRAWG